MDILEIPQLKHTCRIEAANILRVEAKSNYCTIYFVDQARGLVVSKVLGWVQQQLPASMFARIHRSHLVNVNHIRCVDGVHLTAVEMNNGEIVAVSRRRRSIFFHLAVAGPLAC